jgi:hypothetical protein
VYNAIVRDSGENQEVDFKRKKKKKGGGEGKKKKKEEKTGSLLFQTVSSIVCIFSELKCSRLSAGQARCSFSFAGFRYVLLSKIMGLYEV